MFCNFMGPDIRAAKEQMEPIVSNHLYDKPNSTSFAKQTWCGIREKTGNPFSSNTGYIDSFARRWWFWQGGHHRVLVQFIHVANGHIDQLLYCVERDG